MRKKYCRAGQVTDDNMAHAHCKLDNQDYKHKLRICNTAFPQQQWLLECTSMLHCTVLLVYIIRTFPILFEYRKTDKVEESDNDKNKVPSSGSRRVAYLFWGGTRPTHHCPAPPCLLCDQHTQGSVWA